MTYQYKGEPLSIEETDRLPGHDHLSTTEIYLNMSPQEDRADSEENNLHKSTPLDFWNYANAFARAGEVVKRDIGDGPYPEPMFYLFGQSIELSLKAFLLGRGMRIETLSRNPYGHDLKHLLETANKKDLRREVYLYPAEHAAIQILSKPYIQRRFQYSRLELGKSYELPFIYYVERAATRLVKLLHSYCVRNSPVTTER